MNYFIGALLCALCISFPLYSFASQSIITESEGTVCLSEGKTREVTEERAIAAAQKNALRQAAEYVKREIGNAKMASRLQEQSAETSVKVVRELQKEWISEFSDECFKIAIQAEVVPDQKASSIATRGIKIVDASLGSLSVKLWTDKSEYREGEKVTINLKGNKPFYARVVYKDAGGNIVQLLPNPYRSDNFFMGNTTLQIPSDGDRFELEVGAPFGQEEIVVYASTAELGDIDVKPAGGVYEVQLAFADVGHKTRGLGGMRTMASAPTTQPKAVAAKVERPKKVVTAEFSESKVTIRTRK